MAQSSSKTFEGVFAVDKPPHLSSAQVLRDLQRHFARSQTFAPLREATQAGEERSGSHRSKRRKDDGDSVFKMGHGGTLDPLATGVLIVGIGRGTKHLNSFLGCTKTYETVVLFGKGTDTYDVAGKIVAVAPYSHVTQSLLAEKLPLFRGKIKQVPPIYSALKIDGMKAYDYARTGKELPRELESRDMEVSECELISWFEGGTHGYRWPSEEAPQEEKAALGRLEGVVEDKIAIGNNGQKAEKSVSPDPQNNRETLPGSPPQPEKDSKAAQHTHALGPLSDTPSPAPAARIRLTVSSGFYVRSFAHDLGIACASHGMMASLVRSRQGDYVTTTPTAPVSDSQEAILAGTTASDLRATEPPLNATTQRSAPPTTNPSSPSNPAATTTPRLSSPPHPSAAVEALTYTDLAQGEAVWAPKITSMLESWMKQHPVVTGETRRSDDRDRPERQWRNRHQFSHPKPQGWTRGGQQQSRDQRGGGRGGDKRQRRNSSSDEG